jgi:FkbM family methyltransferase
MRLTNNLRARKPELWAHLPRALARRGFWWLQARFRTDLARRPFIATLEPQGRLEVIPGEAISQSILVYGVYEYSSTQLVRQVLRGGDSFVDVGANLGYYTVIGALAVGEAGSVTSFEPLARIREGLLRSLSLNCLHNVTVRSEVAGSRPGPITFYEPMDTANIGRASMLKPRGTYREHQLTCVTLDSVFSARPSPRLIKVDVEGAEADVFEGAMDLLRRGDAPLIIFESHGLGREAELLRGVGYQLWLIDLRDGCPCLRPVHAGVPPPTPVRAWEPSNYFAAKNLARVRELPSWLAHG